MLDLFVLAVAFIVGIGVVAGFVYYAVKGILVLAGLTVLVICEGGKRCTVYCKEKGGSGSGMQPGGDD